jgi:hypothetical protein
MENEFKWVIWENEGEIILTSNKFSKDQTIFEQFENFTEAIKALSFYKSFFNK